MGYLALTRLFGSVFLSLSLLVVCLAEPKDLAPQEEISSDSGQEEDNRVSPALQPWLHQAPQANISGGRCDDNAPAKDDFRIDANFPAPVTWKAVRLPNFSLELPEETLGLPGLSCAGVSRSRAP